MSEAAKIALERTMTKIAVGARSRMIAKIVAPEVLDAGGEFTEKSLARHISNLRGAIDNPRLAPLARYQAEPGRNFFSQLASLTYKPARPHIQNREAFRDSLDAAYAKKIKPLIAQGPQRQLPMRRDIYEFGDVPKPPTLLQRLLNVDYSRNYPQVLDDHERRVFDAVGAEDRVHRIRLQRAAEQRRNSVYGQAMTQQRQWGREHWEDGWRDPPVPVIPMQAWLDAARSST